MMRRRAYHRFSYRDSNFRLCCDTMTAVACAEIVRQRETLEDYIHQQPDFRTSLIPIGLLPDAPEIAQDMGAAAAHVGVGPLAGVAGAIAERAARAALADAAATRLCNMVCKEDDIDPALEYITQVPGIDGALVACGKRVGLLGSLPELVRHADADAPRKITRDRDSATPRH